jgi:two-component system sensor histidine kinase DesK
MAWWRRLRARAGAWRRARAEWRAEAAAYRAARRAGKEVEPPGPPPNGCTLLPWLLMGLGAFSNILQGETSNPWLGIAGLATFNTLYIWVVFRAFVKEKRDAPATRAALAVMLLITCGLALGYGGNWLYFFPLTGLAVGAVTRGRRIGQYAVALGVLAGAVASLRAGWTHSTGWNGWNGWDGWNIAYATFLSTTVTSAILSLAETVRELRAAREELARHAVEEERLRFSRDLHDLLGHTLSVIVVKSEAARRLARHDLDAALSQVTDIESVGRQALTEIREAVTGYREGSLSTELDRARSVLAAAGIEAVVRRCGPPLASQTEALLGWVVREAVTNAVRHSGANRCEITVEGTPDGVRLEVADDGAGTSRAPSRPGVGGTGLKGLTERLAAAGGELRAGPSPRGGFTVTARLPVDQPEPARLTAPTAARSTG